MDELKPITASSLQCAKCRRDLVAANVTVAYLGNSFPVELLQCPGCGMAYVPEDLASGKMQQVEQALEDK